MPHTKETETIQIIGTDNIKLTDHETIQTIDQTIIIITIDHVTILRIEIQITKIDKEIFLNQHTEIIHKIQSSQQIYSTTPKHQRQIKQVQSTEESQSNPPSFDNTETTE